MGDSDSDDELMSRLTSAVMARQHERSEDCVHCGQPHATTVCKICYSAHYCSEVRPRVSLCASMCLWAIAKT